MVSDWIIIGALFVLVGVVGLFLRAAPVDDAPSGSGTGGKD